MYWWFSLLQLYIKVSEDSSPSSSSLSYGTGFSLLEEVDSHAPSRGVSELFDPHLSSLSYYWLAALNDKARLFLPVNLRSQLPLSKGGLFYSAAIMDDVRQYYEANWSSLLLAAAIWLQDRGFSEEEEGGSKGNKSGNNSASLLMPLLPGSTSSSLSPPSLSTPATASDSRLDKFHLVLGLAVQSLCMPATLDQLDVLSNCLRAVRKLLCSEVAQELLASDHRVGVELLSVVHRLLLTSTSLSIHIMSLQVAIIVEGILQQVALKTPSTSSSPDPSGLEAPKNVPMGLETSIQPGESCAYALLQVVACCLLRLVPSLHLAGDGPRSHRTSASGCSEGPPKDEELLVILHAVKILGLVCGVCGPEGIVSVLPPILHMLLSTLAYMCILRHTCTPTPGLVANLISIGLHSLGLICAALPMSHDLLRPQLCTVLQSTLFSILGKNVLQAGSGSRGEEEEALIGMDEGTRMVVVTVMLLKTPHDVCPAPSNLFNGCVSLFQKCLHSKDSKVLGGQEWGVVY